LSRFVAVILIALTAFSICAIEADAQGIFNDFVTLGIQGGMQESGSQWIGYFQIFSDFGPEYSAQLRLAARSALFNRVVPTTFLTSFILNIGTAAQRFYIGAGIGVPVSSVGPGGSRSLQVTAMLGLRAPATPGVIAAIEGGLIAPFEFNELPKLYMSLAFSFPL